MKIGDIVVLVDARASLMGEEFQNSHFIIKSLTIPLLPVIIRDDFILACVYDQDYHYYLRKDCIRPLTPLEKALL